MTPLPDKEANIDHVIVRAPNAHLSASRCKLDIDAEVPWDKPLVLLAEDVYEAAMQPFLPNREIVSNNGAIVALSKYDQIHRDNESDGSLGVHTSQARGGTTRRSGFFFRPGATFKVGVYLDGDRENQSAEYAVSKEKLGDKIGEGTLVLNDSVFVDSEAINHDPFKKVEKITEWRHEFSQIGKELD